MALLLFVDPVVGVVLVSCCLRLLRNACVAFNVAWLALFVFCVFSSLDTVSIAVFVCSWVVSAVMLDCALGCSRARMLLAVEFWFLVV